MLIHLASWLLGLSLLSIVMSLFVSERINSRTPYSGKSAPLLTPFQKADQRREWKKAFNDPAHHADKWAFYGVATSLVVSMTAAFALIIAALLLR